MNLPAMCKSKWRKVTLFLIISILFIGCARQSGIQGIWEYKVVTSDITVTGTININQEEDEYDGFITMFADTFNIDHIEVTDSLLHIVNVGVEISAIFNNDSLIGEVTTSEQVMTIVAAKISKTFKSRDQLKKQDNTGAKEVRYQPKRKPVALIFDSDFGPDYDDVGALAILHAMADRQEVDILATIASTSYPNVAPVLNAFNTYFQRPDIPIAIPTSNGLDMGDRQHWSDSILARHPHSITDNSQARSATELYREILASSPDSSVSIVTVGFLSNMANLLKSEPDQYSDLSGVELVGIKVKELVSMAGWFPQGREFNVFKDAESSIYTFENWPTPIVFSGFEIGSKIKTGLPLINNPDIHSSPVKDAYRISIPLDPADVNGRMSWDQTAVLFSVRGPEPFFKLREGRIKTQENGSNTWDYKGSGHYYLEFDLPPAEVETEINALMMHVPTKPENFVYNNERVKLIMDKDAGPDATEYVTLSIANELHSSGRIDLLAIMNCSPDQYGNQALHAVNKYHGNNFLIGNYVNPEDQYYYSEYHSIFTGSPLFEAHLPAKAIYDQFRVDEAEITSLSSRDLYRKTLADQADKSVVICVDGQHYNLLHFLTSKPDSYSPLTGVELLEKKVKRLLITAGIGHVDNPSQPLLNEWNLVGPAYPEPAKQVIDILKNEVHNTQIIWYHPFVASGDKFDYAGGNNKRGIVITTEAMKMLPDDNPVKPGYMAFMEQVKKNKWNDNGAYSLILDEVALLIAIGDEVMEDYYMIKNDGYPNAKLLPNKFIEAWWTYTNRPTYKNHYYVYMKSDADRDALEKHVNDLFFGPMKVVTQ